MTTAECTVEITRLMDEYEQHDSKRKTIQRQAVAMLAAYTIAAKREGKTQHPTVQSFVTANPSLISSGE